jgi:RNA polymerase sigma factor (sigma-70 family)
VSNFRIAALKELAEQQTRYAPPARRQAQREAAQKLLGEIDPARSYPYQYVCFRITGYRSEAYPQLQIGGEDLRHDLELLIRQLDKSLPAVPAGQSVEPMLTLEELSRRFQVSTKTISRWRLKGLIARRIKINGRTQLGFPVSAVEKFVAEHRELVDRGTRFSHLSEAEKEEILRLARQYREAGLSLTETSRRIAAQMSRSPEAVRYTIKNFDRQHPELALYPHTGPLSAAAKADIARILIDPLSRNEPVSALAKRHGRSRSNLYRIAHEVRLQELLREPIDYIYNPEFDDPTKEAEILAEMPGLAEFEAKRAAKTPPKDVPAYMAHLYEWPLLTREQEQHTFRKMNFLKYKLHKFLQSLEPSKVRATDLQQIEHMKQEIKKCRDLLINCNQRLVYAQAKQRLTPGDNIDDLVSDGNLSLMRAVEKFDYSRGNKFSTYATWAIMKNFARSIPDEKTRRQRFMTGHDELFETQADTRSDEQEALASVDAARDRINRLLEHLDPRTREVIRMRAGLDGHEEMTLEQIGQHFGITKERVRQINVRGMRLLREWAAKEKVDLT